MGKKRIWNDTTLRLSKIFKIISREVSKQHFSKTPIIHKNSFDKLNPGKKILREKRKCEFFPFKFSPIKPIFPKIWQVQNDNCIYSPETFEKNANGLNEKTESFRSKTYCVKALNFKKLSRSTTFHKLSFTPLKIQRL